MARPDEGSLCRNRRRPFWASVALAALVAVATVPATGRAAEASADPGGIVADLLGGIERGLSALRAQLERIDAAAADDGGHARPARTSWLWAPDTTPGLGLGDGGPTFQLRSLETIARALDHHLARLIVAQHRAGDHPGLEVARLMSVDAQLLRWGLDDLRAARDAPRFAWAAARDRIGQALDDLARGAAATRTLAAGRPEATPTPLLRADAS